MIFLQIWIGDTIPKENLDCMKTVLSNVLPCDDYLLACDSPEIFTTIEQGNVTYIDVGAALNGFMDRLNQTSKVWWGKYFSYSSSIAVAKSDMLRLSYASTANDLLYLDCDVKLISRPRFETKKKPHFGSGSKKTKIPDYFLFYTGECSDWFRGLIGYLYRFPAMGPPQPFFAIKEYRIMGNEVGFIDNSAFEHAGS